MLQVAKVKEKDKEKKKKNKSKEKKKKENEVNSADAPLVSENVEVVEDEGEFEELEDEFDYNSIIQKNPEEKGPTIEVSSTVKEPSFEPSEIVNLPLNIPEESKKAEDDISNQQNESKTQDDRSIDQSTLVSEQSMGPKSSSVIRFFSCIWCKSEKIHIMENKIGHLTDDSLHSESILDENGTEIFEYLPPPLPSNMPSTFKFNENFEELQKKIQFGKQKLEYYIDVSM